MSFDHNLPYGVISGPDGRRYEQNGVHYDGAFNVWTADPDATAADKYVETKDHYGKGVPVRTKLPQAGASGTVTSASVVTANGFTGTVADPTTTPAITLKLTPAPSATPASNGDMAFEATSDTKVTLKLKGSDGVVRGVELDLV